LIPVGTTETKSFLEKSKKLFYAFKIAILSLKSSKFVQAGTANAKIVKIK
jgi:hypothetical protein